MTEEKMNILPVLPLRDLVVYPHLVIPLFVGRKKSIQSLEYAMSKNKQILLVTQKDPKEDDLDENSLHEIGTISNILQLLKLPDDTIKVLVEGEERAKIEAYHIDEEMTTAEVSIIKSHYDSDKKAMDIHMRSVINQFEQYAKFNKKIPKEVVSSLTSIDDCSRLADAIATHMLIKLDEKQKILEMDDVTERVKHLMRLMAFEIDVLQVDKRIRGKVKSQMEKSQREYYLSEQMKAIQKELGEIVDSPNEIEELATKISKSGMNKEAKNKAESELKKLKMMQPLSAEATVVRNYIDWLLSVPWKSRDRVSTDIIKAQKILNEDHYGLKNIKERILEYLAVQVRVKKIKGTILCLVGPPGVGKTSLGRSIARATNRKFVRMSLGGVRDEAEIRGHRRTYIGSIPGKIIQGMAKIGKKNPLFLLDEIDKMSMDFRGDPASALLEVLDPEQNHAFNDHYLEVDYDLSEVMFIATANSTRLNMHPALLDRMEIIDISGYTESEKINIATRYLIPKQIKNNGLSNDEINITDNTIIDIIRYYTREAGVRNLERGIASICRKVVKQKMIKPNPKRYVVNTLRLNKLLGVRKFRYDKTGESRVGQVTGLAWTEAGGDILMIEVAVLEGKGKVSRTGQLGDVMKESIDAAMTVIRTRSVLFGIKPDFFKDHDFHIHVPEGAIPKDGPSAGISMCVALISVLLDIPVKSDVAMTGEITLRGEVLPIGGLKEKLLAALRSGIKTVIIPEENAKELVEMPKEIKQNIDIHPVRWVGDVFKISLQYMPDVQMAYDNTTLKSKNEIENVEKRQQVHPH